MNAIGASLLVCYAAGTCTCVYDGFLVFVKFSFFYILILVLVS